MVALSGQELELLHLIMGERSLRRSVDRIDTSGLLGEMAGHDAQGYCVADDAPLVSVLGSRRSGKSSIWVRKMVEDAVEIPDSHQLYINTTRREAWRIAWRGSNPRDGLVGLNNRFRLGAEMRLGTLSVAFPNGALIELLGADDEAAMDKALGGAYHRVWLDEAQKAPHIQKAIEEVLAQP